MKPGRTTYIRVNPKDCMSIIDVLKKIDYTPSGISFGQAVSVALGSMLESLRQAGVIPTRDGFEYLEMMKFFPPDTKASRGRKLAITDVVQQAGEDVNYPPVVPDTPEKARRRLRFGEMRFKKEADPINWSEADQREFQALVDEFL